MKSFLGKILRAVWSFVLWAASPITVLWRGRTLPDKASETDADKSPPSPESWLGRVEKIFLHAKYVAVGRARRRVLRLGVYLPGLLADHFFRDLKVTIFLPNQENGVSYEADPRRLNVYANHLHSVLIEPTSVVDSLLQMKRIDEENSYPDGVERIKLEIEGESREFLCDKENDFFYPATNKAAGF